MRGATSLLETGAEFFAAQSYAGVVVTNGAPIISWTPDLGADRVYTVQGMCVSV